MVDLQSQWNEIIQANIHELYVLRGDARYPRPYQVYIRTLLAFLQFRTPELREIGTDLDGRKTQLLSDFQGEFQPLLLLIEARIQLRQKQVQASPLKQLYELASGNSLYAGEAAFVLGMIEESRDQLKKARENYLTASRQLETSGAQRKALKALQNSVACESRRRPEGNYTSEYEFIAKKALQSGATDVAAVAFNNISCEYQQIGATLVALNYASRALEYFENDAFGTLNHHLAILQRCHLLIELERLEEARVDFERASISPFPAVREALNVIRSWIENPGRKTPSIATKELTASWQLRMQMGLAFSSRPLPQSGTVDSPRSLSQRLTEYEMKLIALIGDSPKSRIELIEALYGDKMDLASMENRIKVFLSRVRKKKPGLIVLQNGKYSLSPNLYPELKGKRVS